MADATITTLTESEIGGLRINQLRNNSLLRTDEQQELDRLIVDIARQPIGVFSDLQKRGLIQRTGIGTMVSVWQQASDMNDATVNMSLASRGRKDRVEFSAAGVPVPVIMAEFSIEERELAASRAGFGGLDLTHVDTATRKVLEKIEDMVCNGSTVKLNSYTLPGLTNHTNRNSGNGADWGTVGNIETNVKTMLAAEQADAYFGPFVLYLNHVQFLEMHAQVGTTNDRTALERVKMLPGIIDVVPTSKITAGQCALVQVTRDVIDVVVAQDIIAVPWQTEPGIQNWKVMAILAPRVKADQDGKSGIYHMSQI